MRNDPTAHRRPTLLLRRGLIGYLMLCLVPFAYAEDPDDHEDGAPAFSMSVSSQWSRQITGQDTGSNTSVTITPGLQWGDGWFLQASADWMRLSGDYTLAATPARLVKACAWAAAHPRRVQQLLANGTITAADLERCNTLGDVSASNDEEGLGDIRLTLGRHLVLSDDWLLIPSFGWNEDTGDSAAGLGTGTRDAILGASVGWFHDRLTVWFNYSHDRIITDRLHAGLRNHDNLSTDLQWAWTDAWSCGATIASDGNSDPEGDRLHSGTLSLSWQPDDTWNAGVWLTRYRPNDDAPDKEFGVSLGASF